MKLLKLALYHFTACCMLGFVFSKIQKFDRRCQFSFGGINFMSWVVRIMMDKKTGEGKTEKVDVATGNIITERYILTACSPFIEIMKSNYWSSLWVVPTANNYSLHHPDKEHGIFPYESNSSACVLGWYQVKNYEGTLEGTYPCKENITDYPDKMRSNIILLELVDEIQVLDDMLFPRMAFDFDVDHIARQIDWLNRFRRARCIVPRFQKIRSADNIPPFFDVQGFHYKTMPFKTECAPTVCELTCNKEKQEDIRESCNQQCLVTMDRDLGTLMCLVRMDEYQDDHSTLYSVLFDETDVQAEWNKLYGVRDRDCQNSGNHRILGAPVVYNGEVIAIVTKCDKDFIMGTSIVTVRHQILKKFNLSYTKEIDFLSVDPSARDDIAE